MYRCMLGGPFFTTVPSGRVGRARDSAYFSNEAFVQGVRRSERDDQVKKITHVACMHAYIDVMLCCTYTPVPELFFSLLCV